MTKGDPTEAFAEYRARRGLSILAEVESRGRRHQSMTPTIQDDPGYVSTCIKSTRGEQPLHLGDDLLFVCGIRSAVHLCSTSRTLGLERQIETLNWHVEFHHDRLVRMEWGLSTADDHRLPDRGIESKTVKPTGGCDSQPIQETPVV